MIATLGLSAGLGATGAGVSHEVQVALAGGAVALAGLPHGAADGWLALHGGLLKTWWRAACFLVGYVALALVVVAGWQAWPEVCLALFLLMSAWHFGDGGTAPFTGLVRIASGGVVLGAPAVMAGTEVARSFEVLSGPGAVVLVEWLACLFWLACVVMIAAFLRSPRRRAAAPHLMEHVALVGLASQLSPLLYFVAYFCGIHSFRHMGHVLRLARTAGRRQFWGSVAVLTLASVGVGALVFFWLVRAGQAPEAAALRVTFVGLAALTLPHMVLVDGLHPWLAGRGIDRRVEA